MLALHCHQASVLYLCRFKGCGTFRSEYFAALTLSTLDFKRTTLLPVSDFLQPLVLQSGTSQEVCETLRDRQTDVMRILRPNRTVVLKAK